MTSTRSKTAKTCRNRALIGALAALGLAWAPVARADGEVAAATATLQATVDETLAILNDKSLRPEARVTKLENIANERFDFPKMAQLVLGKNRAQLSPEQQAQFLEEFKRHLEITTGRRSTATPARRRSRSARGGSSRTRT